MIKIGTSGIGGKKEAKNNLKHFKDNNLDAAEVAFTYSNYLKKEDALEIGKFAKKINMDLSIHSSYFINLNSTDKTKIEQSKKRLLGACEIGEYLQAKYIVFHPGYFGKRTKEETYENIKKEVLEVQRYIKKKSWKVKLAPETTGKINVFGSLDEILKLAKETKTAMCIDFAHLKARNLGKIDYKEVIKKLPKKHIHCHFSGIEYGEKGERHHKLVDFKEYQKLINELKKQKVDCTLICESPDPFGDAKKMKKKL